MKNPAFIALLLVAQMSAQAQFTYTTNNGAITVTGYSGGAVATIPSFVSSIGDSAFKYNKKLNAITIPSNVKDIGPYAFFWCINMTNAVLSNGLLNIGQSAFGG